MKGGKVCKGFAVFIKIVIFSSRLLAGRIIYYIQDRRKILDMQGNKNPKWDLRGLTQCIFLNAFYVFSLRSYSLQYTLRSYFFPKKFPTPPLLSGPPTLINFLDFSEESNIFVTRFEILKIQPPEVLPKSKGKHPCFQ